MAWTLILLSIVSLYPLMIADLIDVIRYYKKAKAKADRWDIPLKNEKATM